MPPARTGIFSSGTERRRRGVAHEDFRARAGEHNPDREPRPDREVDRRPEALVVIELPRRDVVEDRGVLDRVRVAHLVRADIERLEVGVVLDAPDETPGNERSPVTRTSSSIVPFRNGATGARRSRP